MDPTISAAVRALRRGGVVIYPTDTLLGLGASATDEEAVDRLAELKERPEGQPISVAVSSLPELETWTDLAPRGLAFARRHLPGPYTIVARPSGRARRAFAPALFGRDGSIGFRIPDHPVARELARRAGPITATSANRHGRPPARTVRDARRSFGTAVSIYVGARPRGSGRASTLVDLTRAVPRALDRR